MNYLSDTVTNSQGNRRVLDKEREVPLNKFILLNNKLEKVVFRVNNHKLFTVNKYGKLVGKARGTNAVRVVETTDDIQLKYTAKVRVK